MAKDHLKYLPVELLAAQQKDRSATTIASRPPSRCYRSYAAAKQRNSEQRILGECATLTWSGLSTAFRKSRAGQLPRFPKPCRSPSCRTSGFRLRQILWKSIPLDDISTLFTYKVITRTTQRQVGSISPKSPNAQDRMA